MSDGYGDVSWVYDTMCRVQDLSEFVSGCSCLLFHSFVLEKGSKGFAVE